MTSAIGIACGLGRETTAVLSTLLALAILRLIPHFLGRRTAGPPPVDRKDDR
jgi:putative Mg2+ transporter-C (MgtC) family protein